MEEGGACQLRAGQQFAHPVDHADQQRIVRKVIDENCTHSEVLLLAEITVDLERNT